MLTRGRFNANRCLPNLAALNSIQQRFQGGFTPSDMPIIKNKWDAAAKVAKICESMKNVAAGALPGCERHLANARPFGAVTLPLFEIETEPEDIKKVLHIAIGTERGMCGTISSNTVREIDRYAAKYPKQTHQVVVYGKRSASVANTLFGERFILCAGEVKTRVPTFEFCCHLAEFLLYQVEWDKARLYFNAYENIVKFSLQTATIYKVELAKIIADIQFPSYEIEAEESTIIHNLIEFKLASQLYMYMAENATSEQGARLQSMDGATKNCKQMIVEYERVYQGLRKTKITNELIILSTAIKMAGKLKQKS